MVVVGLTGGIGSGKTTVSRLLAERGAAVVDADQVVREVQAPGGAAFSGIVERFGSAILGADGTIDRPKLAAVVFRDPGALADLNRLTHPAVQAVMAERVQAEAAPGRVVVLEVPLLAEGGRDRYPVDAVLVVDCPVEVAVRRLVEQRGMDEEDARRRMAAQLPREERLAMADLVIDNSGSLEHLHAEVDRAWGWIQSIGSRQAGPGRVTGPP